MAIHFPKGEGIKIIRKAEEAKVNDSLIYFPLMKISQKLSLELKAEKKGNCSLKILLL